MLTFMITLQRVYNLLARSGWDARRVLMPAVLGLALLTGASPALSAAPQRDATPNAVVQRFDESLLRVMQDGAQTPYRARYQELSTTMRQTFDFEDMARIATGASWLGLPPAQKAAIVREFESYSVATYLSDFNSYSGQHFEIAGQRETPQGTMVTAKLVGPGDKPVTFGYLLHQAGGSWRIIDIYLNGTISQLAIQRSEFTSVLARQGPNGLVERLAQKTRQLERSAATS